MATNFIIKGFMTYLMIGLVTARPQYNYQSNVASSSHNAQIMQIIPSQAVSHTYLPPVQQTHSAVQQFFPPAAPVQQYIPPVQSSGQQVFRDVSQIPLQNSNGQTFSGQSNSYQSLAGQSSGFNGQSQGYSSGFNGQSQGIVSGGLIGQSQGIISSGLIGQSQGIASGFNGQSQGIASTFNGQSQGLSGGFIGGQSQGFSGGQSSGFIGQSQGISGGFNGQSQGSSGVFNGNSQGFAGQSSSFNQQAAFRPQPRTIVTKDIFVHTAPPDLEEETDFSKQLASIPIRKNYRIIFIKAPTQNLKVAAEALRQAQTINEEKTVIYVLSKKADVADLQKQISQIQAPQTVNQKPEVYFIKYKTNEEAQRAQQEIQAQYDKLGGSTSISNEGIAPIVGALDSGNISASGSGQQGSIAAPVRQYLPSAKV